MTNLEKVKKDLKEKNASLVVLKDGNINEYYQERVKDLVEILTQNKEGLKGATVADRMIGKVAASIMAKAGVKKLYTLKLSKIAIPVLEEYKIKYEYDELIDYVKNKDKTGMCPMESKFKDETDINKIYKEFIK